MEIFREIDGKGAGAADKGFVGFWNVSLMSTFAPEV